MVKIQTCKQPDSQSFKNVFSHLLFVALKIVSLPPGLKNVINFHYGPPSPGYKSTCSGRHIFETKEFSQMLNASLTHFLSLLSFVSDSTFHISFE